MFAEEEAALLLDSGASDLEALIARRVAGEPLETVLGWVLFAGRRLVVRPGVFVPRRRTELLARIARDRCGPDSVLLELCCGVGPVGACVVAGEVHLADPDPAALSCARTNVPHGHTHLSDLYAALPVDLRGCVDVVAANAPLRADRPHRADAAGGPRARAADGPRRRRRRGRAAPPDRGRGTRVARPRRGAADRDVAHAGAFDGGGDARRRAGDRRAGRPRHRRLRGAWPQTGGAGVT
ncbi:hypothetical protein [Nocardioides sp. B-3]|uniref:hypothetical protein n=1 Tax=Nocardioides sp. B-3 TaxID=2895565 RepID=UPI002152D065|nr:hypothetical protein [Nocardioides sp. B-3]UUZ59198.1 hypothetical protein LP418_25340 [Nocardioides sp. B-3]